MAPLYQRVRGQLAALLQQCQQHGIAAPAVQPAALSLGELAAALEVIPDASAIASAKQALAATLGHLAASEVFLAASVSGIYHPPSLPCQWKRESDLLQAAVQSILNWQLLGLSIATDLCRQKQNQAVLQAVLDSSAQRQFAAAQAAWRARRWRVARCRPSTTPSSSR